MLRRRCRVKVDRETRRAERGAPFAGRRPDVARCRTRVDARPVAAGPPRYAGAMKRHRLPPVGRRLPRRQPAARRASSARSSVGASAAARQVPRRRRAAGGSELARALEGLFHCELIPGRRGARWRSSPGPPLKASARFCAIKKLPPPPLRQSNPRLPEMSAAEPSNKS